MSVNIEDLELYPYFKGNGEESEDIRISAESEYLACAWCDYIIPFPRTEDGKSSIQVMNGHVNAHKRARNNHIEREAQMAAEAAKAKDEAFEHKYSADQLRDENDWLTLTISHLFAVEADISDLTEALDAAEKHRRDIKDRLNDYLHNSNKRNEAQK